MAMDKDSGRARERVEGGGRATYDLYLTLGQNEIKVPI